MNADRQPSESFSRTLNVKDNRRNSIQLEDNSVNSKYIAQLKSYLGFQGQANLLADDVQGVHPDYTIDTGVNVGDATDEGLRKDFFRKTSLKIVNVGTNVQRIIGASGFNGADAWEARPDPQSNKLAEFNCTIKAGNEIGGVSPMSVTLAYSNDREGYVISAHDAGRGATRANDGEMFQGAGTYYENGNPLVGHYSSQHETSGTANLLATSKGGSFDIHSKLTAEAARFQCVRDHLTELTNSTVFAFKNNKHSYYSVSFVNLWKNWDAWFNKEYNLDCSKVVAGLRANKRNNTEEIKFKRKRELNGEIWIS